MEGLHYQLNNDRKTLSLKIDKVDPREMLVLLFSLQYIQESAKKIKHKIKPV